MVSASSFSAIDRSGSLVHRLDREPMHVAASDVFKVLVDDECQIDWDQIATGFDDVSYDQTATYSNLLWGEGHMSQIMLVQGNEVLAGARLAVMPHRAVNRAFVYLRGGPFWRRRQRPADPLVFSAAIEAIVDEYCVRRGHHLVITPHFHPDYGPLEAEMLKSAGFRVLRESPDPNRYFVNLQIDQDQQMISLAPAWRRNLKQALKHPFVFEIGDSQADAQRLVELNESMHRRKKFYNHGNARLLPELARELSPPLRPMICLGYYEGRPIVGAALVLAGDTALYLFGGSADSMLPLKSGHALQWWLIQWLKSQGYKWYDLGGESLSSGLRQFKRGLVGKQGRVAAANTEWERSGTRTGRLVAELYLGARAAKRHYMNFLNK